MKADILNGIKIVCYGVLFRFFGLFRLQNKVVFSCFTGKNCRDNPGAISDELYKQNGKIRQIWLKRRDVQFDLPDGIETASWGSIKMIYHLATAKVWVDSHTLPLWVRKRSGQFYLNTWHGGLGMKKVGIDQKEKESFFDKYIAHNTEMVDLFISNSDHLTNNVYKRAFRYDGEILKCGYPKNDVFFRKNSIKNARRKIYKKYNIADRSKVILYAPTFRDFDRTSLRYYDFDFCTITRKMSEKFGGNFVFLIKLHPTLKSLSPELKEKFHGFVDVTDYPDMQELILASDVFITDYSSGVFDFMLTRRPAFLYANDYDEYEKSRGFYYNLRKNEVPFSLAETERQLLNNVENFDQRKYEEKIVIFEDRMGFFENGKASEECAKIIQKEMVGGS